MLDDCINLLKASKESVLRQIRGGKAQISGGSEAFSLIIDGKSLAYALEDDIKKLFLDLAVSCASVICCRSSPKQKALVGFTLKFEPFIYYYGVVKTK